MDPSQPNSEQASELTSNTRALAPDFKVMGELGRGGMGIVYLAIDVNLDREVAIKVLPAHLTEPSGVRDRFLREARTAAKLSHPNIVPVYRADEKDGVVFFVMRHVDGESLAERLASQGPLAPLDAARVLEEVALALDYAHARGVIHRDIKPENILLERGSNSAVVTDFGIARLMEAAPATATGQVLGTVHYMSPEQVLGERVDGRSDVYSLGVVGFKAVTGQLPFDSRSATAVLVEHVMKEPPKVRSIGPGVPEQLAAIIDRCLAKDPAARYQTAGALASALDDATSSIPQSSGAVVTTESKEPRIISEREAQALWSRAAELQSETGVQPALRSLPPSLGAPTVEDRRTLTSGYRLSDVRDAATEVGIPERYVFKAQAELGLSTTSGNAGSMAEPLSRVPTQTAGGGRWEAQSISRPESPSRMSSLVRRRALSAKSKYRRKSARKTSRCSHSRSSARLAIRATSAVLAGACIGARPNSSDGFRSALSRGMAGRSSARTSGLRPLLAESLAESWAGRAEASAEAWGCRSESR